MDLDAVISGWSVDGFAVLPGFLAASALAAATAELPVMFPTADEFHDGVDEARNVRFRDEFGGIDDFPFASVELSLLCVHPDLVALATRLLGTEAIRLYSIEAWAKYTGAADYDQHHHRDYLGHTLVVPSWDPPFRQVEMFVYLCDVPRELGPPTFVSRRHTAHLPALPNWLPRTPAVGIEPDQPDWIAQFASPELYEVEVSAAGPAGTVAAYSPATFHRGTALTAPRGARYTIHVNFRPAEAEWATRHSWLQHANTPAWHAFVSRATPAQLELLGFPAPGHPYWTDETLSGTQARYPNLDLSPWRTHG